MLTSTRMVGATDASGYACPKSLSLLHEDRTPHSLMSRLVSCISNSASVLWRSVSLLLPETRPSGTTWLICSSPVTNRSRSPDRSHQGLFRLEGCLFSPDARHGLDVFGPFSATCRRPAL